MAKRYKFSFVDGFTIKGKPIIKKGGVLANNLRQAERKLKKKYPEAKFILQIE